MMVHVCIFEGFGVGAGREFWESGNGDWVLSFGFW
jgi:hypothetical protein